ncbi:MAG: histone deacetylase family protein [Maritimibacter sp.]
MTTELYTHPACLDHVMPPGHPEQVARLEFVARALAAPAFDGLVRIDAPLGTQEMVRLAHPKVHFERIREASPKEGFVQIDGDTSMSPGSFEAAMRAVGAVTAAVDRVMSGAAQNAFVACRPPGHHAEKATPMGFCLFSNAAIAALWAAQEHGLMRVAVLDFDVHHGNGTQDVLWNESRVRFASTHQMPLYPGTGSAHEVGAFQQIMNVPLPDGSGSAAMRAAWGERILPWVRAFSPDLVIVSAGFDAHIHDPLAGLDWKTEDFGWLTREICDLAAECCEGRVVSTLEGGYDLEALGESVAEHVGTLMECGA